MPSSVWGRSPVLRLGNPNYAIFLESLLQKGCNGVGEEGHSKCATLLVSLYEMGCNKWGVPKSTKLGKIFKIENSKE